jgi:hypothetical protein
MEIPRVTLARVGPRLAFAFPAFYRRFAQGAILRLRSCFAPLATTTFIVCSSPPVHATERHFTFSYEVTTADKGELELENWITWRFHRGRDGAPDTHEFDFRHELEYGITDRLQASLYFADWRINDHPRGDDRVHYDDAALEITYRLSSPVAGSLGTAVYGEIRGGPEFVELESKILLKKNFGKWITAFNATLEGRWVGEHLDEREGELAQTAAVSYEINPRFAVGAEALHEIDIPDWDKAEKSVVWAGPNASVRFGHWYVTVTALARLSDNRDEPHVQARLITGSEF